MIAESADALPVPSPDMRRLAIILLAALAQAGCGLTAAGGARSTSVKVTIVAPAPAPVQLRLQIPRHGYASADGTPTVHGTVSPPDASVYVRGARGALTAVAPDRAGRFAVRAVLRAGANRLEFIGARLGSRAATLRLVIDWRPRTVVVEAPAVASAGTAATVALDPIRAPPPPPTGGDGRWLRRFELTEYYPALESWFSGALVSAPGLAGRYPIDWLYSALGLSMQGEGIAENGQWFHIAGLGAGGWLTAAGRTNAIFGDTAKAPYWRSGGFYRAARGAITYPLAGGGWSDGAGVRYVAPPAGISFAPGPAKPLTYLRSVAVDPRVIALGSYIFIPRVRDGQRRLVPGPGHRRGDRRAPHRHLLAAARRARRGRARDRAARVRRGARAAAAVT
jgi:3D (Asp-Asp-Asp) domain-containing protein